MLSLIYGRHQGPLRRTAADARDPPPKGWGGPGVMTPAPPQGMAADARDPPPKGWGGRRRDAPDAGADRARPQILKI